jgi:glycosyltransferase involved in cell wall biosynthesis
MIGDGPELERIRQIVGDAGVPVHLPGRLDPEVAAEAIGDAQVQVLFSDYEGLPTALLEGMSHGVVPIVSDMRSGIRELVTEGANGFIVGDPGQDLPRVVKQLSSNESLWRVLSRNARLRVESGFSVQNSADRWLQLLLSLLHGREPRKSVGCGSLDLCPPDFRLLREDTRSLNGPPVECFGGLQQRVTGVLRDLWGRISFG